VTNTKTAAGAQRSAEAALEKAHEVLARLEQEHAAAVARQAALAKSREKLALAGHSGSAADKRALDDATNEAARIHLQVENLAFAIRGANDEVAAASQAVERAELQAKSTIALEQMAELRRAGNECAEALDTFLARYDHIYELSDRIRRVDPRFRWPRDEIFEGAVRRALMASLAAQGRRLNPDPLIVAPSQRRTLREILQHFVNELEASLTIASGGVPKAVAPRVEPDDEPPPVDYIEGEEFLDDPPMTAAAE